MIISFSVAAEGTNVLWERVAESIVPAMDQQAYSVHDMELLLNYFPHTYWEMDNSGMEQKFYGHMFSLIRNELESFDARQTFSFF